MGRAEVEIVEIVENRSELCREILTSLPRWFGIPESLEAYVNEASRLPMLGAVANGAPIGFISLKHRSPFASEAYVLGVRPEWHRQGVGRKLFGHAEDGLRARQVRFFTVKTVDAPAGDQVYGATRAFYEAMGFMPIEVFPTLWHERNPCLFMLKPLF
jgi:ribosomal protein S18 acetylase RimI-like enzyme